MTTLSPDVTAALATLRSRWGAAAPHIVGEVMGALAMAPVPAFAPAAGLRAVVGISQPATVDAPSPGVPLPVVGPDADRVYSTGFPALDAILGPGGLPRGMGLSLRGDLSSGRTTLALRLVAEAQAGAALAEVPYVPVNVGDESQIGDLASRLPSLFVPAVLLVGPGGRILQQLSGYVDRSAVASAVDSARPR